MGMCEVLLFIITFGGILTFVGRNQILNVNVMQYNKLELANFFCNGSDSKYFRL